MPRWRGFKQASAGDGPLCRREGASALQLRVVAEAPVRDFVGTKRLEEEMGGAYSWRNILTGWFRSAPRPARPPLARGRM